MASYFMHPLSFVFRLLSLIFHLKTICLLLLFPVLLFAQEICDNCIDDDGDGLIDCYDDECRNKSGSCEGFFFGSLVDSSALSTCTEDSFLFNEVLNIPIDLLNGMANIFVADINNDDTIDLVLSGPTIDTGLYSINAVTGRIQAALPDSFRTRNWITLGDVDNDDKAEIFIPFNKGSSGYRSIARFEDNLGSPTWISNLNSGYENNNEIALVDFNGDGVAEVFMGGYILNAVTGNIIIDMNVRPITAPNRYYYPLAADVLPDNFCVDCSGMEMIIGGSVFSVDIDNKNLTVRVEAPAMGNAYSSSSVADFDLDGKLDILVFGSNLLPPKKNSIFVWNPLTQEVMRGPYELETPNSNPLTISNLDEDAAPEISFMTWDELIVLDDDLTFKWQNTSIEDASSTGSRHASFDLNCDGQKELIVRADDGFIYIFNGKDGSELAKTQCGSRTDGEGPIIADVDKDGHADIICSCFDGVKVWSGAAPNNWAPVRSIYNQYTYHHTNINDDLTIPCNKQNQAQPGLPNVLNSFFTPTPLMDSNGKTCKNDPQFSDAQMILDTFVYTACDSITIAFTICNTSTDAALPADMPHSIYRYEKDAYNLLTTTKITEEIAPMSCRSFSYITTLIDLDSFYIFANDIGSDTIYPPTAFFGECDLFNNSAFIEAEEQVTEPLDLDDTIVCGNDSILYSVELGTANSVFWSTGIETISAYLLQGMHEVTLQYIGGCKVTDKINVAPDPACTGLFMPNAFLANGLSGYNAPIISGPYTTYQLSVYNRFGELVFFSQNPNDVWDWYKGISTEVFTYQLQVDDAELVGNFTIIE